MVSAPRVSVQSPVFSRHGRRPFLAPSPSSPRWSLVMGALALLSLSGGHALASTAEDLVSVQAERRGTAVQISMQASVRAPWDVIWSTLTDYNRLSEFIPGMTSSRVLEKRGSTMTVEQTGSARLWLFRYAIDVVVEVTEQPPNAINVHVVSGNLKQLEGGYLLKKNGGKEGEYLLTWTGLIEPALPVPPAMTLPLIRNNVAQQFEGMVQEIERRAQALPR
jgi:ribosome-associated toxin RatA of RatAB toxin-antitoxin module